MKVQCRAQADAKDFAATIDNGIRHACRVVVDRWCETMHRLSTSATSAECMRKLITDGADTFKGPQSVSKLFLEVASVDLFELPTLSERCLLRRPTPELCLTRLNMERWSSVARSIQCCRRRSELLSAGGLLSYFWHLLQGLLTDARAVLGCCTMPEVHSTSERQVLHNRSI
jgi:hypothetical protein